MAQIQCCRIEHKNISKKIMKGIYCRNVISTWQKLNVLCMVTNFVKQ